MSEFRTPWTGEVKDKGPVLILGLAFDGRLLLVVHDDGQVAMVAPEDVLFDIRYDWKNHQWIDVSEAWSDVRQEERAPDTGREEVPGDLPVTEGTN